MLSKLNIKEVPCKSDQRKSLSQAIIIQKRFGMKIKKVY